MWRVFNVNGHNEEDTIRESLALYQLKYPKGDDFVLERCLLFLQKVPQWLELHNVSMSTPKSLKRKRFIDGKWGCGWVHSECKCHYPTTNVFKCGSKRPPSLKQAKQDLNIQRHVSKPHVLKLPWKWQRLHVWKLNSCKTQQPNNSLALASVIFMIPWLMSTMHWEGMRNSSNSRERLQEPESTSRATLIWNRYWAPFDACFTS